MISDTIQNIKLSIQNKKERKNSYNQGLLPVPIKRDRAFSMNILSPTDQLLTQPIINLKDVDEPIAIGSPLQKIEIEKEIEETKNSVNIIKEDEPAHKFWGVHPAFYCQDFPIIVKTENKRKLSHL